jgi:hypothetical protein
MSERFGSAYYKRFYESKTTRVHGKTEVAHLASGITGFIQWWGGDLRTAIDLGAGAGLMRDWFKKFMPKVRYRSTEYSAYACERYGHEQRDLANWRAKDPSSFDLVICQGVLPYLADAEAARAIENIAAMTGGFLYFEAITKGDMQNVCDAELTDMKVYGRTAAWYDKRLSKSLVRVGAGLYYAKSGPLSFYELEASR